MKADTTITIRMNRQVIYTHGFPFDVVLPTSNDVTVDAMDEAEGGQNLSGPYESVAEFMDALNDEASVYRPMQKGLCIGDQARL